MRLGAGHVRRRDDGELVPGHVALESNVADAAALDRAAHRDAVQHARERQVVDVARGADDFRASLFAWNRLANEHGDRAILPLAAYTRSIRRRGLS